MARQACSADGRLTDRMKHVDLMAVRESILCALTCICRKIQWVVDDPDTWVMYPQFGEIIAALTSSWKELNDVDQFTIMDEDAAPDESAEEAGEIPAQVAQPGV